MHKDKIFPMNRSSFIPEAMFYMIFTSNLITVQRLSVVLLSFIFHVLVVKFYFTRHRMVDVSHVCFLAFCENNFSFFFSVHGLLYYYQIYLLNKTIFRDSAPLSCKEGIRRRTVVFEPH